MRCFARSGLVFEGSAVPREFLDAAEDAAKRVMATPNGYALVYKDRRRVLLQRFPYSLVYRVVDEQVIVVAVVHAKRNPSVWRTRT